ncbi:hypothetical protein LTR66_016185 [Elasticomyces elasticus]|nr:hypothetical protein LTR66_016185 [Elasticomyces elasticus]
MKDLKGLMGKKHEEEDEYGEASMDELWDNAYAKVKHDLKFDPEKQKELPGFREARTPIDQTALIFREWRHGDETKTPAYQTRSKNIRENIQTCLRWTQQACSFVQGHASGTYSQPVDVLMTGMIYLIEAVNQVSQDLTAIDDTFHSISNAMKTINIFETHAIITLAAKKSLVEVFVSMLQFCSYVGSDIRAQSRLSTVKSQSPA